VDDITDERLREIIENTYCCLDEGPLLATELLAARARIKQLEGCLVDRMAEAINKIPSLSDARYMLVLKRKEGP
jgi:hypothetical protein